MAEQEFYQWWDGLSEEEKNAMIEAATKTPSPMPFVRQFIRTMHYFLPDGTPVPFRVMDCDWIWLEDNVWR